MKHGKKKLLALSLTVCMSLMPVSPVYAARSNTSSWGSFLSGLFGNNSKKDTTGSGSTMTLVEDESTVGEDTELRASTYALTTNTKAAATLKYFPVTMYDYDTTTINNATHQAEVDAGGNNISTWNGIYFSGGSPAKESYSTTGKLSYAKWNWWNKDTKNNDYGQYTYSGLVESTLTADKEIKFTKPDGGIFNTDANVKKIYTNVEMPFVYNNGTYTFDASQNGSYFYANSSQGSTGAQSNGKLYFNEGKPQSNGGTYGDGSSTVWMPFNSTQSINGEANCNYHFGMRTTIPFTMTANGKMNPNDDNSEDITFSFSGDDDVWVFIDGQLVLDIGGIHNRLDATINFAKNTWSISKSNNVNVDVADYNGADISGKIFNEGNKTGTLKQTRETFAAKDSHELTIFYLERGAGSSNCKIEFNLPMKDIVSVTKRATQSISSDGKISPLTEKEQEVVNNIDFGFTLTKDGEPVANTNYNLMNVNGQIISTPSTDARGHFTLRNGQTARFVGEISSSGAEYQVVEDAVEGKGFKLPTYTYNGTAAKGFGVSNNPYQTGSAIPSTTENLTSAAVTATGSSEAEDSLQFICENYFDANLANPSSRPVDDQIVIDYGLPVEIDVLSNDVYRGDKIEITDVTGAEYGDATIENGKIKYQLTKQLSGVEVLTYTATVTGSGNAGSTTTTASESNTAKVYIIPATSMYYEENFNGLVTFNGDWKNIGTAQTDPQEPGVVGTVGDSPYGSDAAYINDSSDSNGSSKYVDTTNGQASFSYSFTGTGTSFFARTDANSAYMMVTVKDKDGNKVYELRRNNIYKAVDGTNVGTLYNVPVFTYEADNYGTYTVTVQLMKANEIIGRGSKFYLDGIRVVSPLDSSDKNAATASAAYAADGEANNTVVTLREKLLCDYTKEIITSDQDGDTASFSDDSVVVMEESGTFSDDSEAVMSEETVTDESVSDTEQKPVLEWDGVNFVIFTDSNGEIKSAEEYKSNGPKEEVYLNKDQSVTFSLANWDANSNKIYLGIKAPLGSGSVSINGNDSLEIGNAADCYYDITSYANITSENGGDKVATFEISASRSLISLTNIKVTGNVKFTIIENQQDINAEDVFVADDGNETDDDILKNPDTDMDFEDMDDETEADDMTVKNAEPEEETDLDVFETFEAGEEILQQDGEETSRDNSMNEIEDDVNVFGSEE